MSLSTDAGSTPKSKLLTLKTQTGRPMKDLIVLSRENDPFNSGSPTQIAKAQWFAHLFHQFGGRGIHIRKLHYRVISQQSPILKPDGTPYLNTEGDWAELQKASKHARYQRLIDPMDIADNRNDDPHLLAPEPADPSVPGWQIEDFYGFSLPSLTFSEYTDFEMPRIAVSGYDYNAGEQPFYLEIWIEKTTMNDVLLPLCRKHGVNLITSSGFQSITGAVQCLSRVPHAASKKRPVRVFYVSDYDPAGYHMPVAISRQFEFWIQSFGIEADLKLTPLALTKEQVAKYQLPRVPVKDEDLRKGAWEAIHGEEAVELDALEALYPGAFAEIVEEAILQYRDTDLQRRLTEAGESAQTEVTHLWTAFIADVTERAGEISEQAQSVVDEFLPKFRALEQQFDEQMEAVREQAEDLEGEVNDAIENAHHALQSGLPERPEPKIDAPDESTWLFDSTRSYVEQFDFYQQYKQGEL